MGLNVKPNARVYTFLQFTLPCERYVRSCVEWQIVLNFKPFIIFVSDKKLNWKIKESSLNQEQRGHYSFVIPLNDENPSLVV